MNWDNTFMESLELYEKHSKCSAKQVACILVKDNNILSIGINGTMKGKTNCNALFKKEKDKWLKKEINYSSHIRGTREERWVECNNKEHSEWSKLNEIHAEMNAIKKASQDGNFNLEGSTAYITYSPCFNCAKMLVLFGITKVVFKNPYDDAKEVINFLENNRVEVIYWKHDLDLIKKNHSGFTFLVDNKNVILSVSDDYDNLLYVDSNYCSLELITKHPNLINRNIESKLQILLNISIMCQFSLIKVNTLNKNEITNTEDIAYRGFRPDQTCQYRRFNPYQTCQHDNCFKAILERG